MSNNVNKSIAGCVSLTNSSNQLYHNLVFFTLFCGLDILTYLTTVSSGGRSNLSLAENKNILLNLIIKQYTFFDGSFDELL